MWRSSASKANSLAALVYVGGCPVLWGCLRLFQGVPLFSPCTLFAESRSKRVALPAGLSYVIESAYYPETGEQEMPAGVDEGYLSSFDSCRSIPVKRNDFVRIRGRLFLRIFSAKRPRSL